MIITIDGPVATGKSTVAKKLAQALGFIYFDTGAMYRCLTLAATQKGIDIHNKIQMDELLNSFDFQIKTKDNARHYYVNNEDVTEKIRDRDVTSMVSEIAAISEVRQNLVKIQQSLAKGLNTVFEGRDMGTVVFPSAEYKFFLAGDPQIRAKRRYEEMLVKFPDKAAGFKLADTLSDLKKRDHYDSTRQHSPLQQADDSIVIDTSYLTADEVVKEMLKYVKIVNKP